MKYLNKTTQRYLLQLFVLSLMLLFPGFTIQAQNTVQFSVKLDFADYQAGDKVVVRGSVPSLGEWNSDNELALKAEPDNNKLFKGEARLGEKNINQEIFYKFVIIKGDGTEIWEDRVNRSVIPNGTKKVLETVFFSDRNSLGLSSLVTELTIKLDATELSFSGDKPQAIAIMGNRGSLTFDPEEKQLLMSEMGRNIWLAKATLPYGTSQDIEFKFMWLIDGEWEWEHTPGHINHVAWLNRENSKQSIDMVYVPETGMILPDAGQPHVDNYALLEENLGEKFWSMNHAYGSAMTLLHQKKGKEAENVYLKLKGSKKDDEGIDDFYYRYAELVHNEKGIEAAIAFIESKQSQSGLSKEREAYYEYLKGERFIHEGQYAKARSHFKKVVTDYNSDQLAFGYSEHGMALSYLLDADEDSVRQGLNLTKQRLYADTTQTPALLRYMANAHKRLGNKAELEQVLWQMTQTGSLKKRSEATLELARKQAGERRIDEALQTIALIDSSRVSSKTVKEKEFMELQFLKERGYNQKAEKLKNRLQKKYKGDARLTKYEAQTGGNQ